jgi:formiminoglutamate deiminase
MQRFAADLILYDGRLRPDAALLVDDDGRIEQVGPAAGVPEPPGIETIHYPGALLPGAVNAHSHAFQILLRGRADAARDFRDWVDNYLYPLSLSLDEDGLALASRLAFAEMLKNGVTTVGEFFYLHNAPESEGCAGRGNRHAELVIAAAREVGIRIHLLRCLYDRADRPGQRRFCEPAATAVAATASLAESFAGDPLVTVGIAPHSLHGATAEGIQAAAEYAAAAGQPFQIHLAEEERDLDYARTRYGTTPGRALEQLGVVSERLCVVHGVWLDRAEIETLRAAAAKCADNPAMVEAGVTVGLGCDGPGANHQVNVWQEMRFVEWLQRVSLRRMSVVAAAGRRATANYCFEMGTVNGGKVLGLPLGGLEAGAWADFVVIDTLDLSLLPHDRLDPTALLNNVVNAMAARGAITDVVVGGREAVRGRRLVMADERRLARAAAEWNP